MVYVYVWMKSEIVSGLYQCEIACAIFDCDKEFPPDANCDVELPPN